MRDLGKAESRARRMAFPWRWGLLLLLPLLPAPSGSMAAAPVRDGLLQLQGGGSVGLLHLPADGASHGAVLLVPDLGLTPDVFLHRGRGLAVALAREGRDVYVIDWSRTELGRLEELATRGLPAALRAAGDGARVDVVAHGYAGTFALAAAAGEAAAWVGRVVAINTPVELTVPSPVLEGVLEAGGAFASFGLTPQGVHTLDLLLMDGGSFPGAMRGALRREGLVDLPPGFAADLLRWMRTGRLELAGETLAQRLARYDRPTLLLLPLRDNFAHPEHAAPLRELAPAARVRSQQLSRLDLLSEDYTHLSVLQGREAPKEVWPHILSALRGPLPTTVQPPMSPAPAQGSPEGGP